MKTHDDTKVRGSYWFIRLPLILAISLALGMGGMALGAPEALTGEHAGLVWARGLGGSTSDVGIGIYTDAAGNVYTTGLFTGSADFDPGTGTHNLTSAGEYDVFVSKLDSAGNLVWAKSFGGGSYDVGRAISTDGLGNVYATGYYSGTVDFDPGAGAFNLTSAGGTDIFVSKLDSAGNFLWAAGMGGPGDDSAYGIYVRSSGEVFTTGEFVGTADFDPGGGVQNLSSAGDTDIFVSKLDSSGNYAWAAAMGGTTADAGTSICLDGVGNVFTTGKFTGSADFNPGSGTYWLTSAGGADIFVSKLYSSGASHWARKMGGTLNDIGRSITLDGAGNIYTTGLFRGSADFDPLAGTYHLTSSGMSDIFVSKLSDTGVNVWARQMGGTFNDDGTGISVDTLGSVYTTGDFYGSADFDPLSGVYNLGSMGESDIFVSKMNSFGSFTWAGSMGGTGADSGNEIFVDGSGDVYLTGYFHGTANFNPDKIGSHLLVSAGENDIFVTKLENIHTVFLPLVLRNFTP